MMTFLHTNYATKGGGPKGIVMAKASDTDIICIAVSQYDVSFLRDRSTSAVNRMWPSQHWRLLPVHELCVSIGPQKNRGIHAFTNHGI